MKKKKLKRKIILLIIVICIIILLIAFSKKMTNKIKSNQTALAEPTFEEINYSANEPQISAGMIPVKNVNGNWVITSVEDEGWYNYDENIPAYIMLNDGTYQSELLPDMTGKKLAKDYVGNDALVVPLDGSIYMWIPRFAYKETGTETLVKHIPTEMQPGDGWIVPDMFIYPVANETKPDFSLSGVYVSVESITNSSEIISQMNNENGTYGFIANTRAKQITINDIAKIKIIMGDMISEITNTNRIILSITNINIVEPIKAKTQYGKIYVTYTKNGIKEILDENGNPMVLNNVDGFVCTEIEKQELGDLNKKDFTFKIIDNANNRKNIIVTIYKSSYILANASSFYGEEIDNYICSNKGVDIWRIFHSDGNYMYLIADDSLLYDNIPLSRTGKKLDKGSNNYSARFTSIVSDYSGSAWIASNTNSLARAWIGYINSYPTSTNSNIQSVAYMMDTNAWSVFAGEDAEYAIGGPTLELFCASYKVTHPSKYILSYIINSSGSTGYNLGWSDTSTKSTYIEGLPRNGEFNGIYIGKGSKSIGFWLATPIAHSGDQKRRILTSYYSGGLYNTSYDTSYNTTAIGFRPIVCLKKNTQLQKNTDGTYSII